MKTDEVLCQGTDYDENWYEEGKVENKEIVLTEEFLQNPLTCKAKEGKYVLILFVTKEFITLQMF